MRRRVLILSALFLALAIAPAATAGQPTREVLPAFPDEVLDLCGFPVLDHEEGYAVVESFTDDQGNLVRQIITAPGLRETFTNLDTGKTIVLNNEGPGVRVLNPDGSFRSFTGTGPFVFYFNPFTLGPGLFYATGRFVIARDANGNRTFEIVGTITDVCAELAA